MTAHPGSASVTARPTPHSAGPEPARLSAQEHSILEKVALGQTNESIASSEFMSLSTLRQRLGKIRQHLKIGMDQPRAVMVSTAYREGHIALPPLPRGTCPVVRERQLQVLRILARGGGAEEVRSAFHISGRTAKGCIKDVREALGATTAAQAVSLAYQRRLLPLDTPGAVDPAHVRAEASAVITWSMPPDWRSLQRAADDLTRLFWTTAHAINTSCIPATLQAGHRAALLNGMRLVAQTETALRGNPGEPRELGALHHVQQIARCVRELAAVLATQTPHDPAMPLEPVT
ncbi:hypothetical protein GCM10010329_78300 [Streptomyces spiroverticillatus]|uniref:HTH luxR-type domain-containing protein n=1 Tax=Streptomyces finlayi TaxID=67296 RepID=A0A918X5A9_9ACTN|nr:LuxR C-terminal-related transcriptional regulator [Streptomyces finlayi]GHA43718.1 hypothetical protein GCM10010329_78300 [Streptomyces spiroverticillatus]GHD13208.1 hypothetical protein GCM10010334_71050 [Streptomyces finlayi]